MNAELEHAQKVLAELCDQYLQQKIDLDEFRQRRANLLDELVGREPETMFDTLTREMPSQTIPSNGSESTVPIVGVDTMSIEAVPVKEQKQRMLKIAAAAGLLAIILLLAVVYFWSGDHGQQEDAPSEIAADPRETLAAFAADGDWSGDDILQFLGHWRAMDVKQRIDLRLKPEFKNITRRAQSQLAMADSGGRDAAATAALRELLREIE